MGRVKSFERKDATLLLLLIESGAVFLYSWQIDRHVSGGSALDPTTMTGKIVETTRVRKGLKAAVPDYTNYYDKL